jgi:hypothetical protein
VRRFGSPGVVAAGLALVLIADAAILATAARNRRGGPLAEITLTGRELSLPEFREEDNSGLSLSLVLGDEPPPGVRRAAWRKGVRLPRVEHPWLDPAKLRDLGFRADIDPSDPEAREACEKEGSRTVYLVLEYEGEAWRDWLAGREERVGELRRKVDSGAADRKTLENAEALLALDRTMRSRLFAVDAGLDLEGLLRRYPDRARHAVARGIVSLGIFQPAEGAARLAANLQVLPERVHVPAGIRPTLLPFLPRETEDQVLKRERSEVEVAWPAPAPPRYRAVLALGRRLEPWLVSVAPAD